MASARQRLGPRLLGVAVFVALAIVAWKLAFPGAGPDPTAAATSPDDGTAITTPAAARVSWTTAVPRPTYLGAREDDASTIDAREVAPKRFAHQVQLVRETLRPGEGILTIKIQSDGSLVALVGNGDAARYVATKQDLDPQVPPKGYDGDALKSYRALMPADIDVRVPGKLLRAMHRAGGLAPGSLFLWHQSMAFATQSGTFGDAPMWTVKWSRRVGTVIASADGHRLRAVG